MNRSFLSDSELTRHFVLGTPLEDIGAEYGVAAEEVAGRLLAMEIPGSALPGSASGLLALLQIRLASGIGHRITRVADPLLGA